MDLPMQVIDDLDNIALTPQDMFYIVDRKEVK